VINVLTGRRGTQALCRRGAGNLEARRAARQAESLGEARVSGLRQESPTATIPRGPTVLLSQDSWDSGQAGFRADWGTAAGAFTLQGDATATIIRQPAGDIRISGGNRWPLARQLAAATALQVQAYFTTPRAKFRAPSKSG